MANSTDIFGKTAKKAEAGKGFSIDKATMTFTGLDSTKGLLVQNVQIAYQQQVSFVYDLASPEDVYYISGRTSGTASIGKMVGPAGLMTDFYAKYGNVCEAGETITFGGLAGCTQSAAIAGSKLTLVNPIVTQIGISLNVDTALINENIQIMFSALTSGSAASTGA